MFTPSPNDFKSKGKPKGKNGRNADSGNGMFAFKSVKVFDNSEQLMCSPTFDSQLSTKSRDDSNKCSSDSFDEGKDEKSSGPFRII